MKKEFDYLVVGSGLFGATFSTLAKMQGKKVLVVEKRDHIAGNIFTELQNGIQIHRYGAHIFHTDDKEVWDFVNSFVEFLPFINSPIANFKGKLYNLPFNMNTFYQMWGCITPNEAKNIIYTQRREYADVTPKNLEEQALKLVGRDVYETLIKGYTEKQWGRPCNELPPEIIKRLPVRLSFDNNYFTNKYQGIPSSGYTKLIEKMLEGIEVRLNTNFLDEKENLSDIAEKIIYTGAIDEYFDYCFGPLEYRSLTFKNFVRNEDNFQGIAVMNFTSSDVPYTRIIEHKHFSPSANKEETIISYEYPTDWSLGKEAYYPVNNEKNNNLYKKYLELSQFSSNIVFGGRLGMYKYYDMDKVVRSAIDLFNNINR